MKLAYFVRPHLGGTYSVYANLRAGLLRRGIDMRWVSVVPPTADEPADAHHAHGFFFVPKTAISAAAQARLLIDRLRQEGFGGVFVNVLAEQLQMNLARYLPRDMLRIMIVHSITPATYKAAASLRDNVHATVAVSDRARRDLVLRHGFSPNAIRTIHNAIDVAAMSGVPRPIADRPGLRLLFLGRVEDASKGVMWLPAILERLNASAKLTVAGDGPDLAALRERLARFGPRAVCLGALPRASVPELLARHDVLIMPSRFEGSPVTLMEAMAAGCVPVASRIAGVTDNVVTTGFSGLLFTVGDWRQAAAELSRLGDHPVMLRSLSNNARWQASAEFGLERMAQAYAVLIDRLRETRPEIAEPMPLDDWSVPAGFRPGLRTMLPRPVKNWLRVAYERL